MTTLTTGAPTGPTITMPALKVTPATYRTLRTMLQEVAS